MALTIGRNGPKMGPCWWCPSFAAQPAFAWLLHVYDVGSGALLIWSLLCNGACLDRWSPSTGLLALWELAAEGLNGATPTAPTAYGLQLIDPRSKKIIRLDHLPGLAKKERRPVLACSFQSWSPCGRLAAVMWRTASRFCNAIVNALSPAVLWTQESPSRIISHACTETSDSCSWALKSDDSLLVHMPIGKLLLRLSCSRGAWAPSHCYVTSIDHPPLFLRPDGCGLVSVQQRLRTYEVTDTKLLFSGFTSTPDLRTGLAYGTLPAFKWAPLPNGWLPVYACLMVPEDPHKKRCATQGEYSSVIVVDARQQCVIRRWDVSDLLRPQSSWSRFGHGPRGARSLEWSPDGSQLLVQCDRVSLLLNFRHHYREADMSRIRSQ